MVHWGGITCLLGAAAFHLLSRRTGREVGILKSVIRVYQLKDLAQLVEVESKVFPLIVAVSGRVGSVAPLKCEQSGILGVIVERMVEQQFLKRNWKFSWVQDCASMEPISKEAPWYLEDGTGRVNVMGAQSAISFPLTIGSEVFEKSEPSSSLVLEILDYLKGLKMLGVRHIERVLPTGTPLTVVGEAVKDGIGEFRVQKPEQGPFYVSPIPLDQLIAKSGSWSRWFKYGSIGLTVIGLILISKDMIGNLLEQRRRQQLRNRVVDAAARRGEQVTRALERQHENTTRDDSTIRRIVIDAVTEVLERQNENSSDVSDDQCVICLQQKYNTAFVPCGHMCCCRTCSSQATMLMSTCPICRTPIDEVLPIYRS